MGQIVCNRHDYRLALWACIYICSCLRMVDRADKVDNGDTVKAQKSVYIAQHRNSKYRTGSY
jgi:hypothetical protein